MLVLQWMIRIVPPKNRNQSQSNQKLEWRLDMQAIEQVSHVGDEFTIVQLHPRLLCQTLWKVCQEIQLVTLVQGRVVVGAQSTA